MQNINIVVVLHMFNLSTTQWWSANLMDSAAHWCIPVMVMVYGATLLNQKQPSSAVFMLFQSLFAQTGTGIFSRFVMVTAPVILGIYILCPMIRSIIEDDFKLIPASIGSVVCIPVLAMATVVFLSIFIVVRKISKILFIRSLVGC